MAASHRYRMELLLKGTRVDEVAKFSTLKD